LFSILVSAVILPENAAYGKKFAHIYEDNIFIFRRYLKIVRSLDNSVGIATGYGLDNGGVKNFLFSTSSKPALGPTSLLPNWYRGLFPRGYSGRGVKLKLTIHIQLVPRSGICRSIYPLPHTPS
jgi:hypothetical protein